LRPLLLQLLLLLKKLLLLSNKPLLNLNLLWSKS